MDPVEINAGSWYLRALRADDRVSDVPALADLGVPDPYDHVVSSARNWADETTFVWAVCVPTTGELIALIGVAEDGRMFGRARSGYVDALSESVPVVARFATGALGLEVSPTLDDALS